LQRAEELSRENASREALETDLRADFKRLRDEVVAQLSEKHVRREKLSSLETQRTEDLKELLQDSRTELGDTLQELRKDLDRGIHDVAGLSSQQAKLLADLERCSSDATLVDSKLQAAANDTAELAVAMSRVGGELQAVGKECSRLKSVQAEVLTSVERGSAVSDQLRCQAELTLKEAKAAIEEAAVAVGEAKVLDSKLFERLDVEKGELNTEMKLHRDELLGLLEIRFSERHDLLTRHLTQNERPAGDAALGQLAERLRGEFEAFVEEALQRQWQPTQLQEGDSQDNVAWRTRENFMTQMVVGLREELLQEIIAREHTASEAREASAQDILEEFTRSRETLVRVQEEFAIRLDELCAHVDAQGEDEIQASVRSEHRLAEAIGIANAAQTKSDESKAALGQDHITMSQLMRDLQEEQRSRQEAISRLMDQAENDQRMLKDEFSKEAIARETMAEDLKKLVGQAMKQLDKTTNHLETVFSPEDAAGLQLLGVQVRHIREERLVGIAASIAGIDARMNAVLHEREEKLRDAPLLSKSKDFMGGPRSHEAIQIGAAGVSEMVQAQIDKTLEEKWKCHADAYAQSLERTRKTLSQELRQESDEKLTSALEKLSAHAFRATHSD